MHDGRQPDPKRTPPEPLVEFDLERIDPAVFSPVWEPQDWASSVVEEATRQLEESKHDLKNREFVPEVLQTAMREIVVQAINVAPNSVERKTFDETFDRIEIAIVTLRQRLRSWLEEDE